VLLLIQGIAQVMRCIICLQTGAWPERPRDVEELDKILLEQKSLAFLEGGTEPVDIVISDPDPFGPSGNTRQDNEK
jgi:hypothetical protein